MISFLQVTVCDANWHTCTYWHFTGNYPQACHLPLTLQPYQTMGIPAFGNTAILHRVSYSVINWFTTRNVGVNLLSTIHYVTT